MARTLFDIYRNTETANATATATQSKPRTLFDIYGKQGAENVQNYQSSQVVDTDYNKSGLLGGIGYTLGKFGTGAFSILEGIWDYTAGGIADLFGADEWAEEQFANNVTANWNQDLDEWYNPSKVMRGVGDVASGVGNTLAGVGIGSIVSVASGGTLAPAVIGGIAMGVGAAGMATSEAYAKTGKLGLKEYGYGALVGATEGALETVSGVTGKYAGKLASKMLAKNTAKTVAKNTLIKSIAKDIFNDFKGEFIEEAVSEFISPVYQRWTQVDPNAEYATIQQIGYAGLIGGISGAIMGGVSNGVSAVGMARRGNEIAKSPEHVNSVVNMASRFANYEAENNTGDEAYQYLSQALNDYKARDNGTGILTPVQKQDLAKMERASVILMYSDNVKASKQKIVDNADAFADYINSRNMVDENGNAIRYANGAELLKDDRTVTQFAVADMLGDMLMPTENMYGTVLQQNTNALREEDFANFQKKATPQQKKSINELLGVEVDNITYADFAKAIQNADKTKLADVETGIRARASSKRVLTKAKTQKEKLYDYNENVAIGESPVAFKSNDKEYVITKAKDGFYLYYDGNISRKLTQAELNDAVNEIKNPTVKANTETASTKTTKKTPQKQAKTEESVNAPTETKSQEKTTAKSTKEDNTIKGKRTKKNGVTYIGFNPKDVSRPIHKASMRGAEVLAKASNLEIFMYASKRNADGKLVIELNGKEIPAPNGMFSDGNKIYLDINAGMAQEGTTLFTMSHEVTHYIKKWNEQGYNELADFLFNNYKGITPVESLIKREMSELKAQYQAEGKTLPNDTQLREIAKEEVVANAMSKMLADESSWTKLAELKKQNQTLWAKIGEAISKFLDRLKKAIGVYKGYSLDTRNSAMTKDMTEEVYNKLQDLYLKAFVDADANFGSQDLINREASTEVVAVEDVTKGSYRSLAEACGFVAQEYEDGTRAFVRDGEKVKEITKEDIENSPVGAFISYSLEMGDITEKQADAQKELFVDICNLANETNDFAMTMQFVGSSVFTAMKANADKQYGTTYDFPSICTKTQAVIDAMSAKMVALKRGLTKKEVLELYNEVWNSGNPVPCPECYVFSRWIGIGGLLDNINKYQNFYGEMSPTEVENAYQEMYKDIEKVAQEKGLAFGKAKAKLVSSITKEYNKLTEKIEKDKNQGQAVKAEDEKKLADLEPLMVTVKAMTWIDTVYFSNASHTKVNANYKVPTDVLFDLNKGEIFASKYKEAWKFRTNQGAGYGKAITPYAEAVLGEGVLATNNTTKTITDKANGKLNNIFLYQKGKMTKEAKDKLAKARAKQKNQAFIGMQRFQSTSDARYENASDYLLAMLEMQAMGGGVQVYTKVDGAVPAFATWNCFINQSLMPIGGGLDASGNLADSKTGGMNPKIAFENRAKYETAGTITIGVNDKHIRALYTDVNRDFVIPYHASGGDSNLIAEFRTIQDRNEARNTGVHSTDYSRMQGEKILSDEVLKWQGKTDAEIQTIKDNREARIAILTRGKPNMEVVRNNSFLSELYDKLNGGEWNGVKLAKDKFESQIYPNEYWDKSVGYDRSGVNSQRYLDYCESLGFLHKFSGKVPHRGVLISVKGYDEKGEKVTLTDLAYKYDESGNMTDTIEDFYWKNLVDHRMYGNDGKYLEQRPVKLTNTTTETVTTFAKNNYGRQYNKEVSQATAKRLAEEATMYSTRPAIKGEDKVMTALPSDKISVKDVITGSATVKDLTNQAKSGLAEKTEAMRVLSTNAQATLERVMKEQGIADAEAQVNYVRAGRYASFNAIEKEGGQYNLLGNKRVGMSLGKILEPIYNADKKDGKTYADFELYLLHWHNIERYEAGKPVFNEWKDPTEEHVTSEDSRKAIEELDKIYPDFYKIAERVWRFNDNNLQLCVDSGMWSQEYADELREMYPHYVPTMREEYNTKVSAIMGKNNVSINNAKKKAVGSSEKILPIDDMISAQTIQKTTASRLNNLLVQMLEKGNHAEFEVIGTEDADLLEAYEGVSDMVTFFKDKGKKEHQVTFFYNGKKVTAKVSNLVYEGLNDFQGSAGIQDNLILASIAKANKGFKKLVTSVNPFFSFIRNPVRDMQDALLYTKYTPWQFLRNYKRAQNEIRTNGKYWQEAKSAGIASSSVYDYETGIEYRQKGLKANWKRLLNKLESVSQTIEMSPRLSEYISAREAGLSVEDALLQAQDVTTNFGRGGVFAKKLNSTISPFLNPSIQGFSKMIRAYTGKDGAKQWIALIIKSLILGVGVSALNDLINDDEEEYNDLSDYVKEQNYVIALGNGDFIKIPKGRVFSVFGSAFLRGKRYASGETNAFDDYLKSVASAVTPIDSVARTIISPFQDIATNTTWYGGAIEGQKWNDTAPKNRYDASTSKISIWLGEVFDYSPIKIDYLLDQYSGIVGDLVLPMTSTEAEGGIVTKNLIANSITNSRWSTQFYDTLDEYTYKKTEGDLQAKAVVRYINNVSKTISDMYKQKSEIQADTKKSDKDKLKETKILQATINTLMKETLSNVKEMYDAFGKVDLSTDEAFDKAYYDSIKYFISAEQAFKVIGKDTYEKATKMTKLGVNYDSYYDYYYGLKGIEPDRKADGTVINGSKKAKILKYTKEQDLPIVQQLILIMSQGYTIADGDIKGVTAKTAKTKVAKYIASLNATAKEKTELAEMLGFTVKNGKIQMK